MKVGLVVDETYGQMYTILGHAVTRLVKAPRRNVAGSIPSVVIVIFHQHNPSGRIMALELTQPVTEMSARDTSWR
jgi:hypothetical protein